jgi:serine/threonine protein kinase
MDDEVAAGTLLAGRYELAGLLGQGGMATVREATDQRLGRRVAVKILRADLAEQPRARTRFETEAHAAARLAHPNVVTVFDSGEDNGIPFLVMERLPGRTLADEIAAGPLPIERTRAVVREVLAALAAAHAAGIIHRDIKPGNVLMTDDGHAKVSDFGIAKTLDDMDETQTVELLATPGYLAPERLLGAPASERSDLYSVGVLLYEALSGRRPFRGDTPLALMRAVEKGDAESITALRPEVPADLAATVQRSMAVGPAQRFGSATEMSAALSPPAALDAPAALDTAAALDTPGALDATVAIDRRAHDGATQTLPAPPADVGSAERTDRGWHPGLAVVIGAVLAAIVLAVFVSQRDPAPPFSPIRSTQITTTTSAATIASTAPPTTVTTTVASTVSTRPDNGGTGKGRHKGKP